METKRLDDADYQALAEFRFALREFTAFTRAEVEAVGLTSQQHQALLAIRTSPASEATVGRVAERLLLKPHSATGLVNRMVASGLIERARSASDARKSVLTLTPTAQRLLDRLSATHRDEIRRMRPLLIRILEGIN